MATPRPLHQVRHLMQKRPLKLRLDDDDDDDRPAKEQIDTNCNHYFRKPPLVSLRPQTTIDENMPNNKTTSNYHDNNTEQLRFTPVNVATADRLYRRRLKLLSTIVALLLGTCCFHPLLFVVSINNVNALSSPVAANSGQQRPQQQQTFSFTQQHYTTAIREGTGTTSTTTSAANFFQVLPYAADEAVMMGMWLPFTTTTTADEDEKLSPLSSASAAPTSSVTLSKSGAQIRFKILPYQNSNNAAARVQKTTTGRSGGCADQNSNVVREIFRAVPVVRGNFCFLSLQTKSLAAQKRLNRENCDTFNLTIKAIVTLPPALAADTGHHLRPLMEKQPDDSGFETYHNYYEPTAAIDNGIAAEPTAVPLWKSAKSSKMLLAKSEKFQSLFLPPPISTTTTSTPTKKLFRNDEKRRKVDGGGRKTGKRGHGHHQMRHGDTKNQRKNKKAFFFEDENDFLQPPPPPPSIEQIVGKQNVETTSRQRRAASNNVIETVTHITIKILDDNEAFPLFERRASYVFEIDEDVQLYTRVARVRAGDSDAGLNGNIYYTMRVGSADAAPAATQGAAQQNQTDEEDLAVNPLWFFAIHPTTGVIYTVRRLDANIRAFFWFDVEASDRGRRQSLSSRQQVQVHVIRRNLHKPEIVVESLRALQLQPKFYYFSSSSASTTTEKSNVVPVALITVSDADKGSHGLIDRVEIVQQQPNASTFCPLMHLERATRGVVKTISSDFNDYFVSSNPNSFKSESFYIVADMPANKRTRNSHDESKLNRNLFCTVAISAVDTGYPPLTTHNSIEIPAQNFRQKKLFFSNAVDFNQTRRAWQLQSERAQNKSWKFTQEIYDAEIYECAIPFGPFLQVRMQLQSYFAEIAFSIGSKNASNNDDDKFAGQTFSVDAETGWIRLRKDVSFLARRRTPFEFDVSAQAAAGDDERAAAATLLTTTRIRVKLLPCTAQSVNRETLLCADSKNSDEPLTIDLSESLPIGSIIPLKLLNTCEGETVFGLESNFSYFRINTFSAELTLLEPLDFERESGFAITVLEKRTDQNQVRRREIRIRITNDNDCAPQFQQSRYEFYVQENVPSGTAIGQLYAVDADDKNTSNLTYSLVQSSKTFTIDAQSGKLSLSFSSSSLDRERADKHRFWAQASDSVHTTRVPVTVHVRDVNDNAPVFASSKSQKILIPFDLPAGSVVYNARANDADAGRNAEITYSLLQSSTNNKKHRLKRATFSTWRQNNSENFPSFLTTKNDEKEQMPFEIDQISGTIRTTRTFKSKSTTPFSYNLTIVARDRGTPMQLFGQQNLIVYIAQPPHSQSDSISSFKNSFPVGSVNENEPIGTLLNVFSRLQLEQNDARVFYSLDGDDAAFFNIDEQSGQIRTATVFDRETRRDYWLRVVARSEDEQNDEASVWLYVEIGDVDDNVPLAEKPIYKFSVRENLPPSTFVGQILANDADQFDAEISVIFEIAGGLSRRYFTIDRQNGTLYTAAPLDREVLAQHFLEIKLSSGKSGLSSTVYVTVDVDDDNDNAPTLKLPPPNGEKLQPNLIELPLQLIAGQTPPPFPVYRFLAFDRDSEPQNRDDYSFSLAATSFSSEVKGRHKNLNKNLVKLNEHTGEIFLTKLATRASVNNTGATPVSIPLTVRVKEANQPSNKNRAEFTLQFVPFVTPNQDEFLPIRVRESVFCRVEHSLAVIQFEPLCQVVVEQQQQRRKFWFFIDQNDEQTRYAVSLNEGALFLAKPIVSSTESIKSTLVVHVTDGRVWTNTTVYIEILPDIQNLTSSPKFIDKLLTATVEENAPAGTNVIDLMRNLELGTLTGDEEQLFFNFMLISHEVNSRFRVDTLSGVVTTLAPLDREETKQFAITALVKPNSATKSFTDFCKILISVNDINEHAPVFIGQKNADGVVTMYTQLGAARESTVGFVHANDADYGPNARVSYELVSQGSDDVKFGIERFSGRVYVKRSLTLSDLDDNAEGFNLRVRASDDGRPPLSSTTQLSIRVKLPIEGDEDDEKFASVASEGVANIVVYVKENTPPGFVLAALPATTFFLQKALWTHEEEDSGLRLQLVGRNGRASFVNDKNLDDFFTLTPSGTILLKNWLDYERVQRIDMQVVFFSSATEKVTLANVTIFVVNVNDNAPEFVTDNFSGVVSENAAIGSAVTNMVDGVATPLRIVVGDADMSSTLGSGGLITFQIETAIVEVVGKKFAVESSQKISPFVQRNLSRIAQQMFTVDSNGIVLVHSVLDFEQIERVQLIVSASDGVFCTPTQASVTIRIENVNDEAPEFLETDDDLQFYIPRVMVQNNFGFGTMKAVDLDTPKLFYTVEGEARKLLFINELGNLMFGRNAENLLPEHEQRDLQIKFVVTASDGLHLTRKNATLLVAANLEPADDDDFAFERETYYATIQEESFEQKHLATPKLFKQPQGVAFRILNQDQTAFSIDAQSGLISTTGTASVDREKTPNVTLVIEATQLKRHAYCKLIVTVDDINDNAPQFLRAPYRLALPVLNVHVGETAFAVPIFDADSSDAGHLSLQIVSGDSDAIFAVSTIAANELIIMRPTVLSSLQNRQLNLTLRLTDKNAKHAASTYVVIDLVQHNSRPHFLQPEYEIKLTEKQATKVGHVLATIQAEMSIKPTATKSVVPKTQNYFHTFYPSVKSSNAAVTKLKDVLHYIIETDNDEEISDFFHLNFNTGVLKVARPLPADRNYSLIVKTMLRSDANVYARVPVDIQTEQQNKCTVKFNRKLTIVSLMEQNVAKPMQIATVAATSSCALHKLMYFIQRVEIKQKSRALQFAQQAAPHCYPSAASSAVEFSHFCFTINEQSGDLYHIASPQCILDYESSHVIAVTVGAKSNSSELPATTDFATVRIDLRNINDSPICFRERNVEFYLDTSAANENTFVGALTAIDADDDSQPFFAIVADDDGGSNENETFKIDATFGVLRLNRIPLEWSETSQLTLNVSVSDGRHTDFARVTIHLTDDQNLMPAFEQDYYTTSIANDKSYNNNNVVLAGSKLICVAIARTTPSAVTKIIAYNILAGNTSLFSIDTNGCVWLRADFDAASWNILPVTLTVQAVDSHGYSAYTKLIITAPPSQLGTYDSDEPAVVIPAIFSLSHYEFSVKANMSGRVVRRFVAHDSAASFAVRNRNIQFSMTCVEIACNLMPLRLDALGELETAPSLAAFVGKTYSFIIEARGADMQQQQQQARVMVHIVDEQAQVPTFINSSSSSEEENIGVFYNFLVPEESQVGSLVPEAIVKVETESNFRIRYDLVPKGGDDRKQQQPFVIDAQTGQLIVAKRLDFDEAATSSSSSNTVYEFGVRAQVVEHPQLVNFARVRVTLTDINDNAPLFMQQQKLTAYVPEVVKNDQELLITRVEARDRDSGENGRVLYRIREIVGEGDGNDRSRIMHYDVDMQDLMPFTIDQAGWIRTRRGITLDREITPRVTLVVEARDNGSPASLSSTCNVTVIVVDTNDNPPYFRAFENELTFNVTEDSNAGTLIGVVELGDRDENSRLALYAVSTSNKRPLPVVAVEGDSHQLRLIQPLHAKTYEMALIVTDGKFSATKLLKINVIDVNNNSPECDNVQNITAIVPESSPAGTLVYELEPMQCHDADLNDKLTFALLNKNARASYKKMFVIDEQTGAIRTANDQLDAEKLASYNLSVMVSDRARHDLQFSVMVNVGDVDDNEPKLSSMTNNTMYVSQEELLLYQQQGDENAVRVIGKFDATDADVEHHNRIIRYALVGVDEETRQAMQIFTIDEITGVLTMQTPVNAAAKATFSAWLNSTLTDNAHKMRPIHVAVQLSNADNTPQFKSKSTKSLKSTVTIVAIQPTNQPLWPLGSNAADVAKHVREGGPVFAASSYETTIPENFPLNTPLPNLKLSVTVPQPTLEYPVPTLVYSIHEHYVPDEKNAAEPSATFFPFQIAAETGVISLKNPLDFESESEYSFIVRVENVDDDDDDDEEIVELDDDFLRDQVNIHIIITDVNDVRPQFLQTSYVFNVSEAQQQVGAQIGQVEAFDPEAGRFGQISYSIEKKGVENAFRVDEQTGAVFLTRKLDYEESANRQYKSTVVATDRGGLLSSAQLTVNVLNANDNVPICRNNNDTIRLIGNNKPISFRIDVFDADDDDADASGNAAAPFVVMRVLNSDLFAVDSATGQLTITTNSRIRHFPTFLDVKVMDNGGLYSVCRFPIQVLQDDDDNNNLLSSGRRNHPPQFAPADITIQPIRDDDNTNTARPNELEIARLHAVDVDADDVLQYGLSEKEERDETDRLFRIDRNTGTVFVSGNFAPTNESSVIILNATASDGTFTVSQPITVNILPAIEPEIVQSFATVIAIKSINVREFAANHQTSFKHALAEMFGLSSKQVRIVSMQQQQQQQEQRRQTSGGENVVEILFLLQQSTETTSDENFVARHVVEATLRNARNRAKLESVTGLVLAHVGATECDNKTKNNRHCEPKYTCTTVVELPPSEKARNLPLLNTFSVGKDKHFAFKHFNIKAQCVIENADSGTTKTTNNSTNTGTLSFGGKSFVAASAVLWRRQAAADFSIELGFRSSSSSNNNRNSSTLFSYMNGTRTLAIDSNGFLTFSFTSTCGGGPTQKNVVVDNSMTSVSDGEWHKIRVTINDWSDGRVMLVLHGKKQIGWSQTTSCTYDGEQQRTNVKPPATMMIYFGAQVESVELSEKSRNEMLKIENGFVGCITHISVDNVVLPLEKPQSAPNDKTEVNDVIAIEQLLNIKYACAAEPQISQQQTQQQNDAMFVAVPSTSPIQPAAGRAWPAYDHNHHHTDCRTYGGCEHDGLCARVQNANDKTKSPTTRFSCFCNTSLSWGYLCENTGVQTASTIDIDSVYDPSTVFLFLNTLKSYVPKIIADAIKLPIQVVVGIVALIVFLCMLLLIICCWKCCCCCCSRNKQATRRKTTYRRANNDEDEDKDEDDGFDDSVTNQRLRANSRKQQQRKLAKDGPKPKAKTRRLLSNNAAAMRNGGLRAPSSASSSDTSALTTNIALGSPQPISASLFSAQQRHPTNIVRNGYFNATANARRRRHPLASLAAPSAAATLHNNSDGDNETSDNEKSIVPGEDYYDGVRALAAGSRLGGQQKSFNVHELMVLQRAEAAATAAADSATVLISKKPNSNLLAGNMYMRSKRQLRAALAAACAAPSVGQHAQQSSLMPDTSFPALTAAAAAVAATATASSSNQKIETIEMCQVHARPASPQNSPRNNREESKSGVPDGGRHVYDETSSGGGPATNVMIKKRLPTVIKKLHNNSDNSDDDDGKGFYWDMHDFSNRALLNTPHELNGQEEQQLPPLPPPRTGSPHPSAVAHRSTKSKSTHENDEEDEEAEERLLLLTNLLASPPRYIQRRPAKQQKSSSRDKLSVQPAPPRPPKPTDEFIQKLVSSSSSPGSSGTTTGIIVSSISSDSTGVPITLTTSSSNSRSSTSPPSHAHPANVYNVVQTSALAVQNEESDDELATTKSQIAQHILSTRRISDYLPEHFSAAEMTSEQERVKDSFKKRCSLNLPLITSGQPLTVATINGHHNTDSLRSQQSVSASADVIEMPPPMQQLTAVKSLNLLRTKEATGFALPHRSASPYDNVLIKQYQRNQNPTNSHAAKEIIFNAAGTSV